METASILGNGAEGQASRPKLPTRHFVDTLLPYFDQWGYALNHFVAIKQSFSYNQSQVAFVVVLPWLILLRLRPLAKFQWAT